jgi:hypothetical protein
VGSIMTLTQIYEYIQIASMIIATASTIAAITPSPKDDTIIAKLKSVIDIIALNVGHAKK